MSDFLLEVRVKNNRIIRRIQGAGFSSIAEFCRTNMLRDTVVGSLISFKLSPRRDDGEWREVVYDISSALHCEPEELFSERQLEMITDKSVSRIEMSEGSLNAALDNKQSAKALLSGLSPREVRVINMRFYEGMALRDAGREEGVTGTRIAQIEAKALRRLKRIAREKKLEFVGDESTCSQL